MTSSTFDQRLLVPRSYMNLTLDPALAAQTCFSTAGFPTPREVAVLDRLAMAAGLDHVALLHDDSAATALEKALGNWRPVVDHLAGPPADFGFVAASAAAFAREVARCSTASVRARNTLLVGGLAHSPHVGCR